MSAHRSSIHLHVLTALLPLLLAAILMIGGANHASTWSDEGWNLWVVEPLEFETTLARLAANHHPPLYFLSLDVWQQFMGDSKLALRFLAIAGGLLTVAMIYRIGADHFGRTAGLMAALLFAVMEQAVYYSQAIRHYGWLILGVVWMTLFFLRILKQPRTSRIIGYAVGVTFALYTMYLSVFIVAIHGLVWLIWQRAWRDKLRVFAAWVAAGVLLLPWLIYAIPGQLHKVQRGVIAGYHNSFATTPENVLKMADLVFGGQFALMGAVCALAIWQIVQNRRLSQITLVLSGIILFVGLIVLNLVVGLLAERTLYFLLPSILLVIGYGFQLTQPRLRVLAGVALISWLIITPQHIVPRINSDVVAKTIAEGYSAGDLVLLETGFDDVAFENELKLTLPLENRQIFRSYYEYDYADDSAMLMRLNDILQAQQRVWLVYWNVPQRLGQMLETMGFAAQAQYFIPMGVNDPIYVAYPTITLTFYTRPLPDAANRLIYGDLFTLEDSLIVDEVGRGEKLYVDLWWSPLSVPDRDYSISVSLLDMNGITQLQHFGPSAGQPTIAWQVGLLYYDRHTLDIPTTLATGRYQVVVTVYWYQTPATPLLVQDTPYAVISELTVR